MTPLNPPHRGEIGAWGLMLAAHRVQALNLIPQ